MARRTIPLGRRAVRASLLPLAFAVLTACAAADGSGAGNGGGPAAGPAAAGGIKRAENDLLIRLDRGDGTPAQEYTLVCAGFVEGSHPDPQAACDHLATLKDPFAPLPDDQLCTEIYGGPETARITGLWHGEPVDLELSRVDGCRIAQWDGLGPVLPTPAAL